VGGGAGAVAGGNCEVLAQDEGEVEGQFLVVGQAQEEGWGAVLVVGWLGVLDVLDDAVVAKVAPGSIAGGGEGIGRDVEKRAVAGIGDVERGHRDWGVVLAERGRGNGRGGQGTGASRSLHRVWSRR